MSDVRYALVSSDEPEPFWLDRTVTIGRHLDNDLVVAGEDVRDFHARVELSARGPRITPVDGSTVHVGGHGISSAVGLMPGDEIVLGQHVLRLIAEGGEASDRWALHDHGTATGVPIADSLLVGRAEDCALRILEGHISRRHARLELGATGVWLKDLESANGTYVNGERVRGACRLFHGDEVAFDVVRYQLIGDAPDLTPIRPVGEEPDQLEEEEVAPSPVTIARGMPSTPTEEVRPSFVPQARRKDMPAGVRGPALLGQSDPVSGRLVPLAFGRHGIGRDHGSDILLAHPSVSGRHAEIEVKADGVYLVNLLSTNGTLVNGREINTCRLEAGDQVQFGQVRMEFVTAPAATRRIAPWAWAGVGLILLGAVAAIILLA